MNRASPRELIAAALLDFEWSEATDYGRSDALRFADSILALLSDSSIPGERERALIDALRHVGMLAHNFTGDARGEISKYVSRVLSASPTRSEPTRGWTPRELRMLMPELYDSDEAAAAALAKIHGPDAGETTP